MPEGASRLDDSHVEVAVGDISDWLFVPEPEREARLVVLYALKRAIPTSSSAVARFYSRVCLPSRRDGDINRHRLIQCHQELSDGLQP